MITITVDKTLILDQFDFREEHVTTNYIFTALENKNILTLKDFR